MIVIVSSVESYLTWVGIDIVKPAWLISIVFVEIPGTDMFFAKNVVLGHLLYISSNYEPMIGYDKLSAFRNVSRFGLAPSQSG